MRLAADEYEAFVDQLRQLDPQEWTLPTPCTAWDVHALVCHVLGSAEMSASLREQFRQMRAARKAGGLFIDALTDLQVRKHAHRTSADLVAMLTVVGRKAAAGRRRTPAPVRRVPMAEMPVDETGNQTEKWTLGYLTDVILTRDTWMHRSDIAVATGRAMSLRPEHDGVLVADIAAEWADRHGRPCTLTLTGPAGGHWRLNGADDAAASYDLDAVDFCRILAGRGKAEGLLTTRVPF
jgi:uncharacterized protein (TIGR03083 family)